MRIVFLSLAALAVVSCATPPAVDHAAATAALATALRNGDLAAVEAAAIDAHRPREETALARAALDSWWRRDALAAEALTRATADPALSPDLRCDAFLLLAGVHTRQGRYGEAAAALGAALPLVTDEDERGDTQDARDYNAALADAPPMRAEVSAPGSIPLTRDRAGLSRAPISINGGSLDAIVDSGSSVSSISESNARRLGLQMLPGQVSMGTSTSANVTAGLALASDVTFGGARFHNVVFLVMPDSVFSFANGAYVVQGIVGMPILLELGRVEYRTDSGKDTLSYARTGARPGAGSNLIVEGTDPYTFAGVDGSARLLRLFIDNGANTTHLNRRFLADFPALAASAHPESVTRTGAAGSETQDALKLPSLTLHFGETAAPVSDIDVIDDHNPRRHGDIGLDALRTAPGYVLDFEAMRFALLKP